jgi:ADP-heptose:LPS heptosyltransferase
MSHGIGDVVCAKGVVDGLRLAYPSAYLCCIVKSATEHELLKEPGLIDEAIYFNTSVGPSWASILRFVARVRAKRFDTFVAVTDLAPVKAPLIALLSGARVRVGERWSIAGKLFTHSVSRDDREHKVLSNDRIARLIGATSRIPPQIELSQEEINQADALFSAEGINPNEPVVVLHVGSGAQATHKRWPLEKFVALVNSLWKHRPDVRVVLVGGPDETAACNELRNLTANRLTMLAGRLTIRQVAAVGRRASVVVGSDSGIMHVAAAVGTSVVAMIGPTRAARTAPFGAVVVSLDLACSPCFPFLPNGCGRPICMQDLGVDRALAQTLAVLGTRPAGLTTSLVE